MPKQTPISTKSTMQRWTLRGKGKRSGLPCTVVIRAGDWTDAMARGKTMMNVEDCYLNEPSL